MVNLTTLLCQSQSVTINQTKIKLAQIRLCTEDVFSTDCTKDIRHQVLIDILD